MARRERQQQIDELVKEINRLQQEAEHMRSRLKQALRSGGAHAASAGSSDPSQVLLSPFSLSLAHSYSLVSSSLGRSSPLRVLSRAVIRTVYSEMCCASSSYAALYNTVTVLFTSDRWAVVVVFVVFCSLLWNVVVVGGGTLEHLAGDNGMSGSALSTGVHMLLLVDL